MFERRTERLLSRPLFVRRMAASAAVGLGLVLVSLAIGTIGYRVFEKLPWLDAFLNAAMLLSGEGPLASIKTTAGKVFAGVYAIYCGIAVISAAGVIFAPLVHRSLHRFHLARKQDE